MKLPKEKIIKYLAKIKAVDKDFAVSCPKCGYTVTVCKTDKENAKHLITKCRICKTKFWSKGE